MSCTKTWSAGREAPLGDNCCACSHKLRQAHDISEWQCHSVSTAEVGEMRGLHVPRSHFWFLALEHVCATMPPAPPRGAQRGTGFGGNIC